MLAERLFAMITEPKRVALFCRGWGPRELSPEHWQIRAAAELAAAGEVVRVLKVPDPTAPNRDDWTNCMLAELFRISVIYPGVPLTAMFHSLSAATLYLVADQLGANAPQIIDRALLVATPDLKAIKREGDAPPGAEEFFDLPTNSSALNALVRKPVAIISSNDCYADLDDSVRLANDVQIPHLILPGAGHIGPGGGFGPWPGVIRWYHEDALSLLIDR